MKDLAILEVSPKGTTDHHKTLFYDRSDCDFFFVTHDEECSDALAFNKGWSWGQNRSDLARRVPRNYRYYCFIDYDVSLRHQKGGDVVSTFLAILDEWNPAVLVTRSTSQQLEKADQVGMDAGKNVGIGLFGNNMLKIVHHSLLDYFFPLPHRFGGFWDCCQVFNMLEAIPFPERIIRTYDVTHASTVSSGYEHNSVPGSGKRAMHQAYTWMMQGVLPHARIQDDGKFDLMKRHYQDLATQTAPKKSPKDVIHGDRSYLARFFDLKHEQFANLSD